MGSVSLSGSSGISISGSSLSIVMQQTSTPSIGFLVCASTGEVFVQVNNNDSVEGIAEVSYTSNFAAGTVYSDSVSGGGFVSIAIPGYSNPPGTITVYARVTATGKLISNTASRTQTLSLCID